MALSYARPHTDASAAVWLRRFLALDAAVTGVNGLAYLLLSGPCGRLLGVGQELLAGLGAGLVLYAVAVGWTATRRPAPRLAVRAIVEINLAWAVLSIAAMTLWFDGLTTAGTVWAPLQAAVVAGFAVLQYTALRRVDA
ncbi:hypothetical protein GCM10009801_59230 [Streptomyces albiaxialis]|uniref:Integral membrane protein n=1 Tax=Streptomyces albiaxialis TaxID=329523 RepID=A0ABN2WIB1_9ACTN